MKAIRILAIALAASILAGCTDSTPYGDCIGAFDDKATDTKYEVSVKNVIIGVILAETVVVPVIVILDQTHCPVAKKPTPQK